jgi:hypothetical protein
VLGDVERLRKRSQQLLERRSRAVSLVPQ